MKSIYHAAILTDRGTPTQATITVYNAGTMDLATIYSDYSGTPKDNPFQTDILGRLMFFANSDFYDIKVSGSGITTYTIEDVFLAKDNPWIDVREYISFSAAIDAIDATEAMLLIPNEQAVSTDKTVPSNITLFFTQGGSLNIATDVTVTINGHVEAGLYQIFKWTGTGKVVFGAGAVKEIYPEWFGAKGDGVADDSTAIQAVFSNASVYNISFPSSLYRVNAGVSITRNGVHLSGSSYGTTIKGYGAINILTVGKGDHADWISDGSIRNIHTLAGDSNVLRGILINEIIRWEFHSPYARGGSVAGIEIRDSFVLRFFGGGAISCSGHGVYLNKQTYGSNEIRFYGTMAVDNNGVGFRSTGGSGQFYDVYCEQNDGGGVHLSAVMGFSINGYFENNLSGFDIKADVGSGGGSVAPGAYLTNLLENDHKYIWLTYINAVEVGPCMIIAGNEKTGHTGVYVDEYVAGLIIRPISFNLNDGATGVAVGGPNLDTFGVVSYVKAYPYSSLVDAYHNPIVCRMTTYDRDTITPANGMIIYNTTLDKFQGYENGAWVSFVFDE